MQQKGKQMMRMGFRYRHIIPGNQNRKRQNQKQPPGKVFFEADTKSEMYESPANSAADFR